MMNWVSIIFDNTISRKCKFDCLKRSAGIEGIIVCLTLYSLVFALFLGPESNDGLTFSNKVTLLCFLNTVVFVVVLANYIENLRWSVFKPSLAKEKALTALISNRFQIENELVIVKHRKNCCHIYIPVSKEEVLFYSFNSDYSYSVDFTTMAKFKKQAFLNPDSKKVEFIRQCESSTKLVDSMNLS